MSKRSKARRQPTRQVQGPWTDLALHSLGWKAFQDLCAHVCEDIFNLPVEMYREAQDGGQDAVFTLAKKRKKGRRGEHCTVTVQCKFSSKAEASLKPGDLTEEEANVLALRSVGEAEIYILMTSMAVAAPTAVRIKRRLRELGVVRAHVFGREFLTRVIRSSAKLRALVPRVYGLGDLSLILDERMAAQTRALLGHMLPTLQVYVPTKPHKEAVHAISKHGIVLLLGDPATGKSTIGAILATIAAENADHRCYKIEGPEELITHWNPNEPGGFYWIDDAFGPNQLREDFVDRWIAIMPKVQAAIVGGNRFILTSRKHIYEAAKPKLGTKNHPLFRDNQAIVNVGALTTEERRQILYNHIKSGRQPHLWKAFIKPHLDALANEPNFLPEIARRLGDQAYTQHLSISREALVQFVRNPKEHLSQTVRELSKIHRAALTLVFLHRGNMPVGAIVPAMKELVIRHFGVDIESLGSAIAELRDSFLVQRVNGATNAIAFKHPTISDALAGILGETDGMRELYLRGAKAQTILTEVLCSGVSEIEDAVIIDPALEDLLIERIAEIPDEPSLNRLLFAFLDERASDTAFRKTVARYPTILGRKAHGSRFLEYDSKIRVHAKALRMGLLSDKLKKYTEGLLEAALVDDHDMSFLQDDDLLRLIRPTKLLTLLNRIRDGFLVEMPSLAQQADENADLDIDPEDNFSDLVFALRQLDLLLGEDELAKPLIDEAETRIAHAIDNVKSRKKEKEEEPDDWDWYENSPQAAITRPRVNLSPRSIFSDVDE